MMSQVRYSLGTLNGITKVDINRIFLASGIEVSDLNEIMKEYPENVFVMKQPIYNLLTLIMIKSYMVGNTQLALDTNGLLGLVMLARLKYKYIRVINHEILEKTLSTLTKKTYIGMHGAIWMVNKICRSTHDKWIEAMINDPNDTYARYRYIIDMRNKFNQVVKTVARAYYYNIANRHHVDINTIISDRTTNVLNYITQKSIPTHILEYAGKLANVSSDKIASLHHDIQIYASMQSQISIAINMILHRLYAYINAHKDQFGTSVNINDPTFVLRFFTSLKKSTLVLKTVSDRIFSDLKYNRFEVLSYALTVTLFIDSMNNVDLYNGSAPNYNEASKEDIDNTINKMDTDSRDDQYDYSANYSDSSYLSDHIMQDDNFNDLELLFEGVIYT